MLRIKAMKLLNGKTVNFELNKGEAVIIRGKNGSGKSLLMKSIARLLPSGFEEFSYEGKNVSAFSPEQLRSEILYISATPSSMNQGTVEDYFKSAFQLQIYKNFTVTFPWQEYLKKWNLSEGQFQNLSSGQKQMLSILRALSLKAKVLLLDEPTANLDHEKTLEIEGLIRDWMRNTGGSVVMISHSDEQTSRLGFKVVRFEDLNY
jgi:ABC-type iron transport system FetAB ATPase subunit